LPTIPEAKEDGTPLTEEEKQVYQKEIEETKARNDKLVKDNEELSQMQSKIRIDYRNHKFEESNECALVTLLNYREPPKVAPPQPAGESPKKSSDKPHDTSKDEGDMDNSRIESVKSGERDEGTFEEVPPKIILANPRPGDDINVIIVHTEAQMGLRKLLIEIAKKHFKELEKLDVNSVFSHPRNKSELLEERFIEHAKKNLRFEKSKPVPVFEFKNNAPPNPDEEEQQPTPSPE
jgi:hypothetical protein